jgi:hypothetical protein
MKTPLATIFAAIALALIGFLAGTLLTTEDRRPGLSAPSDVVTPSPGVDDRLGATLSILAEEMPRLREAIEALSRREAVEVSSYRETPAVADLADLLASLKRAIESVGTPPSMPPTVESHDPTAPLAVPEAGWRKETYDALRSMDYSSLNRAHQLWTQRDVIARYGHPTKIVPSGQNVNWLYEGPDGKHKYWFRFFEGTVCLLYFQ